MGGGKEEGREEMEEWKEGQREGRGMGERRGRKEGGRRRGGKEGRERRGGMWVHREQVYNNKLLTGSVNLALATVDWSLVLFRTCSGGVRS